SGALRTGGGGERGGARAGGGGGRGAGGGGGGGGGPAPGGGGFFLPGGAAPPPLAWFISSNPMHITEVRAVQPIAANSPPDWRTSIGQMLVAIDTDKGLTGYGVGGGGPAGVQVVPTVAAG